MPSSSTTAAVEMGERGWQKADGGSIAAVRVHVAIVSDQLLPTVIPCLMARPERVVLVASKAMAEKARRLQEVMRADGLAADIRDGAPDAGLSAIRFYAAGLAQELAAAWPDADLVLNATGGTKLMTLGFVEGFRERAARIIYTDTAHARMEVIHDRRLAAPRLEPMQTVLDVPRYLAVQGFRYRGDASSDGAWTARIAGRQEAARYLAEHAQRLGGFIGAVNALAHQALDEQGETLVRPDQLFSRQPDGRWWPAALRVLDRTGVIRWKGEAEIQFPDAESARFLGGGWLEEQAFAAAKDAGLHDVRMNVQGVWEGAEQARNEFDVLACHLNRLLFVECKTMRFPEGKENDNQLAYKVDSLGLDTRGLFGEIWVLSAREPTPVLTARARQAGFRIVGPADLPRLQSLVRRWKEGF